MSEREYVPSPCISVCALDDNDICMGCSRTGQEIIQWGKMNSAERKEVLKKVAEREAAHYINAAAGDTN